MIVRSNDIMCKISILGWTLKLRIFSLLEKNKSTTKLFEFLHQIDCCLSVCLSHSLPLFNSTWNTVQLLDQLYTLTPLFVGISKLKDNSLFTQNGLASGFVKQGKENIVKWLGILLRVASPVKVDIYLFTCFWTFSTVFFPTVYNQVILGFFKGLRCLFWSSHV